VAGERRPPAADENGERPLTSSGAGSNLPDMENSQPAQTTRTKRCFVVSEFGADEVSRVERKQTLKHLVRRVLEPMGYEVQRADDIDDLGQITHQIIERLLDDDLVVADLTGLNPNVFYELAVRHAVRKPVVTLMTFGQDIPFDLKDVRTVFYDLHDPDKLEAAQQDLEQKVRAIEDNPTDVRNPITVARNVTLLQQSDDPDERAAGAILSAVSELGDDVKALALRLDAAEVKSRPIFIGNNREAAGRLREVLARTGKRYKTSDLAREAAVPVELAQALLEVMLANNDVWLVDNMWSADNWVAGLT
jgi:hypothetical protein